MCIECILHTNLEQYDGVPLSVIKSSPNQNCIKSAIRGKEDLGFRICKLEVFGMIPKLAKVLGALVIIGLIIFAVISFIIPGVFSAFKCAMTQFLTGAANISTCAALLDFKLK